MLLRKQEAKLKIMVAENDGTQDDFIKALGIQVKDLESQVEAFQQGGGDRDDRGEIIEILLRNKADMNAKSTQGSTALFYACRVGSVEVATLLVESKADPNLRNEDCYTCLHEASKEGHEEVTKILIESCPEIEVNKTDGLMGEGSTALHYACNAGDEVIVEQLVQAKADIDATDKDQWSPLHHAALSGNQAVVASMLNHGNPVVDALNEHGQTALQTACEATIPVADLYSAYDNLRDAEILEAETGVVDDAYLEKLREKVIELQEARASNPNPNPNPNWKVIELHEARENKRIQKAKILSLILNEWWDYWQQHNGKVTIEAPWREAPSAEDREFIESKLNGSPFSSPLPSAKPSPALKPMPASRLFEEEEDSDGEDLYHEELAYELQCLQEGISGPLKEQYNNAPRSRSNPEEILKLELKQKQRNETVMKDLECFLNLRSKTGARPIHKIAEQGHYRSMMVLIKARCDVTTLDGSHQTALYYAVTRGHATATELLLRHGANMERYIVDPVTNA